MYYCIRYIIAVGPCRARVAEIHGDLCLFPLNDHCVLGDAGSVCKEETALAPGEHRHRQLLRPPASPRHRPIHRAKNPRHSQILRLFQKRRRPSRHQRHRPQKTGKDAQVPYRRQAAIKEAIKLSANRRPRQTTVHKIPSQAIGHACTHRKRRRRAIGGICALPVARPFRGEDFHNRGNHAPTKENRQA
jgi:hypothetical protein